MCVLQLFNSNLLLLFSSLIEYILAISVLLYFEFYYFFVIIYTAHSFYNNLNNG